MRAKAELVASPIGELVFDALTVWRVTRLITADDITAGLRDRWIETAYKGAGRWSEARGDLPHEHEGKWAEYASRDPDVPKLAQLIACPHCVSMWVTFGAVGFKTLAPGLWRRLRPVGALAGLNSLIADLKD